MAKAGFEPTQSSTEINDLNPTVSSSVLLLMAITHKRPKSPQRLLKVINLGVPMDRPTTLLRVMNPRRLVSRPSTSLKKMKLQTDKTYILNINNRVD
jgi:hypothetical protein